MNPIKFTFFYLLPIINVFFYYNTKLIKQYFPSDIIYGIFLAMITLIFFRWVYQKNNYILIKISIIFSVLSLIMGIYGLIINDYLDARSIKIFFSSLFFIFGYYLVQNEYDFNHMIKGALLSFFFFMINAFVYNYFNIGPRLNYNIENSIIYGAQGINTVQLLPFYLLISFFYLRFYKVNILMRYLVIASFLGGLFLLISSMKRGSILAVIFGIFFFIYNTKLNLKFLFLISLLMILGTLFISNHTDEIKKMYERRKERLYVSDQSSYTQEERYQEFFLALNSYFKKPQNILFGQGVGSEFFISGNKRMIHSDMNFVFYSMGMVGLLLYLSIYFISIRDLVKYNNLFFYGRQSFKLLGFLMLIYLFFVGLSGALPVVQNRAFPLFILGGVLKIARSSKNIKVINTN